MDFHNIKTIHQTVLTCPLYGNQSVFAGNQKKSQAFNLWQGHYGFLFCKKIDNHYFIVLNCNYVGNKIILCHGVVKSYRELTVKFRNYWNVFFFFGAFCFNCYQFVSAAADFNFLYTCNKVSAGWTPIKFYPIHISCNVRAFYNGAAKNTLNVNFQNF